MKKFGFGNLGSPLAVLLLLSLLVLGCRKDRTETLPDDHSSVYVKNAELAQAKQRLSDPLSIKFFDFGYATNANPNVRPLASGRTTEEELLNGVAYELLQLNQAYNFVPRLISRSGFPYWSHAEIFNDEHADRPVVLLPFAHLNSDSVEAVLLATPLVDTAGWYTTLYTRKQLDSLVSVTATDTDGLGFKVVSFIVLDNKLFGKTSQTYVDWVTDVLEGPNLSAGVQDRCGVFIEWCIEIGIVVYPLDDNMARDRELRCFNFVTPCPGAYSGPGASNCWLNENFIWICDYMLVNWDPNGSGGGGGGENPIIPPGTIPSGDIGTDILNLFNNGQISEEVMNQLLTIHFSMGLTGNDLLVLTAKPEMRDVLAEFILINAGNVNPLTPAEIRAVWDFAIQYDLTPEQFRALLMNRGLFQQVKNYTEQHPSNYNEKVEVLHLHIDLILDATDRQYAIQNHNSNYPSIGTIEWANTLNVIEEGIVDDFMELKAAEKSLTLQYIPAAIKIRKNKQIARSKQKAFWGSNPNVTWLGKGDAFLHTYFQAINTQRVGAYITKLFADAHETEHPPILHLETEMDLTNNSVGIQTGVLNPLATIHSMADIVHARVLNGDCVYLDTVDHLISPPYDECYDPVASPHCLNGILPTTEMKWTNQ